MMKYLLPLEPCHLHLTVAKINCLEVTSIEIWMTEGWAGRFVKSLKNRVHFLNLFEFLHFYCFLFNTEELKRRHIGYCTIQKINEVIQILMRNRHVQQLNDISVEFRQF